MRAKQMLATMSHEIRSPLSGVVSIAEILATTNLDRHQRQLLNVMLSSGDLVLQLINDILDLSKVESGLKFFPFLMLWFTSVYCLSTWSFSLFDININSYWYNYGNQDFPWLNQVWHSSSFPSFSFLSLVVEYNNC